MPYRYLIRLAYLGTDYAGWWWQPDMPTVSGTIKECLSRLGEDSLPQGASRTDAGVHARDQVATVDCQKMWDAEALARALNAQLPPSITITHCSPADRLEVNKAVRQKTYAYRLATNPSDPLSSPITYRCPWTLDHETLDLCAALLPGDHNAAGFARTTDHRDNHHVCINSAHWQHDGTAHTFSISADRFTYHLVRSLTAVQCLVARGGAHLSEFTDALHSAAPGAISSQTVPAHGLCLERIDLFENEVGEGDDEIGKRAQDAFE